MDSNVVYHFEYVSMDGETIPVEYETGTGEEGIICQDIEGNFNIYTNHWANEGMVQ